MLTTSTCHQQPPDDPARAVPFTSELRWRAARSITLAVAAILLQLVILDGGAVTLAFTGGATAIVLIWAAVARRMPYEDAMEAPIHDTPGAVTVTGGAERVAALRGGAVGLAVVATTVVVANAAAVGEAVAGVVAGLLLALAGLRLARVATLRRLERRQRLLILRRIDPDEGGARDSRFFALRG